MAIPHHAAAIDHKLQGHAAQLQQAYRLTIKLRHNMLRVSQPRERHAVLRPIGSEVLSAVRTDVYDFASKLFELCVLTAQLRQVLAAIRSEEASIENQVHQLLAGIVREPHPLPRGIRQREIRRRSAHVCIAHAQGLPR